MVKNYLFYCFFQADGNFPQFMPILFSSLTWKTRKRITGSSFLSTCLLGYFQCFLSVLTPPTSLWRRLLESSSEDWEANHTVTQTFGPATTNSSVSFGRRLPDSNSCKTEKPQLQSTQTINANTADILIRKLRHKTSEFESPYLWIVL